MTRSHMTEHDTALLGTRQGPEGRVGGLGPAPLQPDWPVSHPSLPMLPDPGHSATLHHSQDFLTLPGPPRDPWTFAPVT